MASRSSPNFPKLSGSNYGHWAEDMTAWLRNNGLLTVTSGSEPVPLPNNAPNNEERKEIRRFNDKKDGAIGAIFLHLEDSQKVYPS